MFRFPILTTETYPQLVQATTPSLRFMSHWLRNEDTGRLPGTRLRHIGAITADGLLIGHASALGGPNGNFSLRPGHFKLQVWVNEEWRWQGAGTALYAAVERFAIDQGATALEAEVDDANATAMAFALRRGFQDERHIFASSLDLTTFDSARHAGVVASAEAAGIRFVSYADFPQDDSSLRRFRDLLAELLPDAPDQADVPVPTVERVRSSYLERLNWDPSGVLLAVDRTQEERWVAMAHVTPQGDHGYYNTFTGVRRPYRGRGLGQAMKLQAIG